MARTGLYPGLIQTALERHVHLPVRSEMQRSLQSSPRYQDLFVDTGQLSVVRNPDWQVIYGRRGTGKTLLLSVLREETEKAFDSQRILSIQITLQDCLVSPTLTGVTDRQRALGYFQTFIELLSNELSAKVDHLLGKPEFLHRVSGAHARKRRLIEEKTLEILDLCQIGRPVKAFGTRAETVDKSSESKETLSGKFSAQLSSSIGAPAASVEIGGGASGEHHASTARSVHEEAMYAPRFALMRKALIELLQFLHVAHLNILLDEWQTLDPHGSSGIQSEFAEYLKRTFAGAPSISVKIATNRYQTRFNNMGRATEYRGFEVGADLFEATNLDRLDQTDDEQFRFYVSLLFRRLAHCNPDLNVLDPDSDGHPDDQFVTEIFRSRRAFETLIKGAAATPRDFLLLFNRLAKERQFKVVPLWTAEMANDAIREGATMRKEETDPNSEADQLLSKCVRPIVEKTGSRLFLVARDDRGNLNGAIEELIEKRLIDQVSSSELGPDITNRFDAFLVHYGFWLGWRHPQELADYSVEMPQVTQANAAQYLADISPIERDLKRCGHWGDVFNPTTTKSFVVAGLCPQCFKPAMMSS